MEALLDFFDSTDSQPPAATAPRTSSSTQPLPPSLPPEVEVGNVEYKLKLLCPTASRFEHLVTQMKWRLREGQGEAIYEIGVSDSGIMTGLCDEDMEDSIATLRKMAERLDATVTILRTSVINPSTKRKSVSEVLVRKVPDDQPFLHVRLSVLGPMEAGKSTLLGVLTQGEMDNGRGSARLNLFRHLHEIQSGRTSSISHEILGFDAKGEVVDYSTCISAEEICEASSKLITFIDLAGHQKYMKTTIFGLTAHCPDIAMLVIGANSGVVGTACEHLGFSIALDMPIFVVVTKADLCTPQQVQKILEQLERLLSSAGCKKVPYRVNTESDAYNAAQKFSDKKCSIAPIFTVSCVTGENLNLLRKFLNAVPPTRTPPELHQQAPEFQVDEIFNVPDAGTVLGGVLTRGIVREGDPVIVGPREDGTFVSTSIATLRRNRTPCRVARAGEAVTVTLTSIDRADIRKGTVLLSPSVPLNDTSNSCAEFEADMFVLFSTRVGVRQGFQGTIYVASAMQNAIIQEIKDKESLAAGEKGRVKFKYMRHPEFLRVGSRVLFREGRTKGVGEITKLFPGHCEEKKYSPNKRKPTRELE